MEGLIDKLSSQPWYIVVAIILIFIMVFAGIKKLARLALLAGLILVLYLGYLVWTGKKTPKMPPEIRDAGEKIIEDVQKRTKEEMRRVIINREAEDSNPK